MTTRLLTAVRLMALGGAATALMFSTSGCQTPERRKNEPTSMWPSENKTADKSSIDPTKIEKRDDIVRVVQFWPQTPWLFESDNVIGFKATIYFISGETTKGAFVPRDIMIWMNEVVPGANGEDDHKLLYMWQFGAADAMGYRVNHRSVMGYYYGFPLRWPEELDVEGKLVEFQFGYERADKRVVLSSPKRFRVPTTHGFQPATARTEN